MSCRERSVFFNLRALRAVYRAAIDQKRPDVHKIVLSIKSRPPPLAGKSVNSRILY